MQEQNGLGKDYIGDAIALGTRYAKAALVALFLVSLVALVYYLFKGYIPEFHTDSAFKSLVAGEAIAQGSYFPPEWNYVNGDLWVLFGQIFIIPLLFFFPNSYALHAVSGLISSVIVLLSLWCVSGMVVRSRWMRLLTVTIFAGGLSWFMAENLFGQVSYGNVLYLQIFTLYFSWRSLEANRRRTRLAWLGALAVLSVLTFWGNPQRAAAYDLAPMLAALLAWASTRHALLVWSPGARRWKLSGDAWHVIAVLAALLASAAVGVVLHSLSIAHVHNNAGAGSARWLTIAGARDNLWFALEGVLGAFGALPTPGRPVMSLAGAYEALRLLGILLMLILIPVASCAALRNARPSMRMLGAFAGSGLCLFAFLQITTTTPDMTGPIISSRYMLPSLILGIVLLVGYAETHGLRTFKGLVSWAVLLVLLSSLIHPSNSFSRLYRGTQPSAHVEAMDALKREGLHYGYASYWNSGVITVLSSGDVKVRQIDLQGGIPVPRLHLASNTWYRPDAWKGETFLMLTRAELVDFNKQAAFSFTGQPVREFVVGDFVVFVFKANLATTLPGWDTSGNAEPAGIGGPLNVLTRHQIGQLETVQGRPRLSSKQGEVGFLHFGPYVPLKKGDYQIRVDIAASGEGDVGYVDVVSGMGASVLAKRAIVGKAAGPILLPVSAKSDLEGVEVRVFSDGSSDMVLSAITLAQGSAQLN
jgi:hypothetical protein